MDVIVWARENPVLVVAALAIAVLVVVAMRMARVPDSAEEPHPRVPDDAPAQRVTPARAPFVGRTQPMQPTRSQPVPPRAADRAPAGYVPLEVPALWEPPAGYLGQSSGPSFVRAAPAAPRQRPAFAEAPPARPPVRTPSAPTAPRVSAAPRSFDDLRRGALAGRSFDSLQQFAVAAVVDAGHPVVLVARIFRVPSWKLEAWVEAAFHAAPAPLHRPWRGTMPRTV